MNIVDLLLTIVVVTILVTIVLAVITYIAYKLRLSREPDTGEVEEGPQYFVPYPPPRVREEREAADDATVEPSETSQRSALESHATEA